jgi:hypothetical protein
MALGSEAKNFNKFRDENFDALAKAAATKWVALTASPWRMTCHSVRPLWSSWSCGSARFVPRPCRSPRPSDAASPAYPPRTLLLEGVGSGDVRMKVVSRLVAVCFMVVGIAALGAQPVAATSDCLKECRQQVTACKRAATKQARDCSAACRAKRADCPADATTESCPALAAARQCATRCRHQDRDQARACFDAARHCRSACPRT